MQGCLPPAAPPAAPGARVNAHGMLAARPRCSTSSRYVRRSGGSQEIYRVLKPGGGFAGYEWCSTDMYDPSNETHRKCVVVRGDWPHAQPLRHTGTQHAAAWHAQPLAARSAPICVSRVDGGC